MVMGAWTIPGGPRGEVVSRKPPSMAMVKMAAAAGIDREKFRASTSVQARAKSPFLASFAWMPGNRSGGGVWAARL